MILLRSQQHLGLIAMLSMMVVSRVTLGQIPEMDNALSESSAQGPMSEAPLTANTRASFAALSDEEKQKALERLSAVWQGQKSEIVTAEIDYLALMFTLKSRQLSCDEFISELLETPLTADDTLTQRLVTRFCPEKLVGVQEKDAATLKAVGDWRTFRQRGSEIRCLSDVFEHVIYDDLHLLADHPNRDARAYRPGTCPYWHETLEWFRVIPNEELFLASTVLRDSQGHYRLEFYGPGSEELSDPHASWMLLDAQTGLPREWRLYSPRTGELQRVEMFQYPVVFPGDVSFPTLRVKADFKDDKVTTVRMSVIRDAQFNISFDENDFRLSVPDGWTWYDFQTDQVRADPWKKPVEDVARFFRSRTSTVAQEVPPSSEQGSFTNWRSLLLIVNGAILMIIGIAIWRRTGT